MALVFLYLSFYINYISLFIVFILKDCVPEIAEECRKGLLEKIVNFYLLICWVSSYDLLIDENIDPSQNVYYKLDSSFYQ